jgi:mRNA interferase HigB
MLIVGAEAIAKFLRRNRQAAKWMEAWTETTLNATWANLQELRRDFPSADGVPLDEGTIVTVFNAKGNTYRLLTLISYQRQIVQILDVLTHAQYDKGKWKGRS